MIAHQTARAEKAHHGDTDTPDNGYMSAAMTRKVLAQALQQKREIDAELDEYGETGTTLASASATAAASSRKDTLDDGGFIAMEGETAAPSDLDDAERRALESFMSKNVPARRTIADIIFEKIREKVHNNHSTFCRRYGTS